MNVVSSMSLSNCLPRPNRVVSSTQPCRYSNNVHIGYVICCYRASRATVYESAAITGAKAGIKSTQNTKNATRLADTHHEASL